MTDTILRTFFDNVNAIGDERAALRVKKYGAWQDTTWGGYGENVSRAAEGLRALGVGLRSRVAILAENSPEWLYADIATMCLGGAGAGIYPSELPDKVKYLVEHSEARVLVVDSPEQLAKTDGWRDELESLVAVVVIDKIPADSLGGKVISWQQLIDKGAQAYEANPGAVEKEARKIEPDSLAMMVYTSGTTGPPKGAMYSHGNIFYEARVVFDIIGHDAPTTISFLPMCHIAERLQGQLVALLAGATVNFAESVPKLKENLLEVRPTVLLAVPRVWEKFYAGIRGKFDEATGIKAILVKRTMKVGKRVALLRNQGKKPPLLTRLEWKFLSAKVVGALKEALGIDKIQMFVSGAAPLSGTIAEFFGALEVDIHEVYGQTECIGVCTCNPHQRVRFGTVGKPVTGCEVRLAEDGEVLVKGPNVFMGYLKDEAGTAEAIDADEWLHTGDIGQFDAEGYLRITDRKKDIIVTAGGKNVAPQNLENKLKTYPGMSQAVVIGDKRRYLVALVTLDPLATKAFCEAVGISEAPTAELASNEKVRARIQEYIDDVNKDEPRYGAIKYFKILDEDLSIENDEVTPTLKVKRRVVQKRYADQIAAMYPDD